jgi:hypothetical protein
MMDQQRQVLLASFTVVSLAISQAGPRAEVIEAEQRRSIGAANVQPMPLPPFV